MKNIIYELDSPDNYKFEHPCGNVIKNEEKFFYDPDIPKTRVIFIDDLERCKNCVCFFSHDNRNMCQGIEIKVEKR